MGNGKEAELRERERERRESEREERVSFRVGYKFQGFCLLEKMTHRTVRHAEVYKYSVSYSIQTT